MAMIAEALPIIQYRNDTVGNSHHVSLPRAKTCPGRSHLCDELCYGKKGCCAQPHSVASYERFYKATLREDFADCMIAQLARKRAGIFRIHAVGDFYSAAYINKWRKIVQASPHIKFWTYTRSWRIPWLYRHLRQLAALPNMSMFWSTDAETHARNGAPPHVPYVRVAHLRSSDDETIPWYADVVWCDHRGVVWPEPYLRSCPQGLVEGCNCRDCQWCVQKSMSRRDRLALGTVPAT